MQLLSHARFLSVLGLSGAALLAAAVHPGETEISFAPEEGLVLEKRATFRATLELIETTIEFNGEEMDVDAPDVTQSNGGELVFTDRYAKVSGARVERLERTFDDLLQTRTVEGTPGGEGDLDEELESPLEGATVVFTWDAESEEYEAAYAEDSAESYDEDLLEELDLDVDYAELLPDGAVEEGASWSVDADTMGVLLSLGGELKFDEEEDTPQEELISEAMDENLEGEATLTFGGMRDLEGREVAVIAISWDAEGTAEGDDEEDVGDGEVTATIHRTASVEVVLEGELLWDVAAGHFARLEVAGMLRMELDESTTIEAPQGSFEQRSVAAFEGPVSLQVAAEAP